MLIIGSSQAVSITPRPMLVIEGISKVFGRVCAVDNLSLSIPGGQFVGVIGRSGAGKSTLLRLLNRLTEPTGGRIFGDGTGAPPLRDDLPANQFGRPPRRNEPRGDGGSRVCPRVAIPEQAVEPRGQDHRD